MKDSHTDHGKNDNDVIRVLIINIGDHYFGTPIHEIQDVIQRQKTTQVPLTQNSIIGLLNLRGHIVTEVNMATALNIPSAVETERKYSIVIGQKGELYSLAIDDIGDVIDVQSSSIETIPETIDRSWINVSKGVIRLPEKLVVILNLEALITRLTQNAQDIQAIA
jgi:purine-binding chemotaxis protein CheW